MYCAEWTENNGKASNIVLPDNAAFITEYKPDLVNGIVVVKSEVPVIHVDDAGMNISTVQQPFMAIPYYAWANRGRGEMQILFPEKLKYVELLTSESGKGF